jgi:hypothetical protein
MREYKDGMGFLNGLFKIRDKRLPPSTVSYFLLFPIFRKTCKKYDIAKDEMRYGRWELKILLSLDVFQMGVGFRFFKSWSLIPPKYIKSVDKH